MRLTKKRLELYSEANCKQAIADINRATTAATRKAKQAIGRRYDRRAAVRAIAEAVHEIVSPVLWQWRETGADDSEPRRAVQGEVCNRIARHYELSASENDHLYYSI